MGLIGSPIIVSSNQMLSLHRRRGHLSGVTRSLSPPRGGVRKPMKEASPSQAFGLDLQYNVGSIDLLRMHSLTRCYIVGFLIVTFQSLANCQYPGEQCFHQKKGVNGICRALRNCPAAIDDLHHKIYPQNCGFEGVVVIVCCPQASEPSITTTTTTESSQILDPTGNLRVGEKCKQACKEYKELGYKKEYLPVLAGGNNYEMVENCPWDPESLSVIYGGTEAEFGEFPHMALIGYGVVPNHVWKCGGTLISDRFVLTAAHCIDGIEDGYVSRVRLGDLNFTSSEDDQYAQQINVKKYYIHPAYVRPKYYNDIALLELEKPAKLSLYVKPACLKTDDSSVPRGLVTGWGHTEHHPASEHLLKAGVHLFTLEECNRTFWRHKRTLPRGIDPNLQLCYGSKTSIQDSCQGDSGGPIQIYAADVYCSYYVFGVTSFGISCGNQNIPGGYVKLKSYIKWIEDIVWP
ncbi:CLIPC1 [Trypoxylus dichotomus]